MVRALLAGTKTQTRRDMTKTFARYPHLVGYETDGTLRTVNGGPLPYVEFVHTLLGLWHPEDNPRGRSGWYVPLKAAVGDRLWVRETWQGLSFGDYLPTKSSQCEVRYFATDPCADLSVEARGYPWRPSIFMPRHASRLTLLVTDVRVERLQDITEYDALAEGVVCSRESFDYDCGTVEKDWFTVPGVKDPGTGISASDMYAQLWNIINGDGAWQANPWIVAYTFSVIKQNIDKIGSDAA